MSWWNMRWLKKKRMGIKRGKEESAARETVAQLRDIGGTVCT